MSALKSRINFLQETSKPITSLNPELAHNVMKHIFDFAERSQRVIDELTETFYFEDDSLKIKI
ncbi:MAG: hypothetical protein LBQ24_04490 [Candidatus Peribacteria bacterium]|jgi:hypothetical protein|nr:hypothetical protein [Candidatus Peribacteria bacterium]